MVRHDDLGATPSDSSGFGLCTTLLDFAKPRCLRRYTVPHISRSRGKGLEDCVTDEELAAVLEKQRDMMIAVATGGPRVDDVNLEYKRTYGLAAAELAKRS